MEGEWGVNFLSYFFYLVVLVGREKEGGGGRWRMSSRSGGFDWLIDQFRADFTWDDSALRQTIS